MLVMKMNLRTWLVLTRQKIQPFGILNAGEGEGFLGRPEFYNALWLVTVAQTGRRLTPDIVKSALYGPAAFANSSTENKFHCSCHIINLEKEVLKNVWDLSDQDKDGMVSENSAQQCT